MRILVIEDEKLIANSLKKGLEQERFAVDVAYDGISGYDLAEGENYDLIVLDLMLPGMDGMVICKNLREAGKKEPILMLTAKGQIQERVEGLNCGADDYLSKPFSFDELLARIRALLRRPAQIKETVLKVGDLSLNTANYEAERGDKKIVLSGKEYTLLEYLMRNANQTLSKEQIRDHVWSYEADILPNTIEVYIRNLRKKIDEIDPERPALLNTVRGFGYRIGE